MRTVKKIEDWKKDKEPHYEFLQGTHEMIVRRLKDGKIFASEHYEEFINEIIDIDFCRVHIGDNFWAVIGCFQPDMIRISFSIYKGQIMAKYAFCLCDIDYFEGWIYDPEFLEELKKENL